MNFLPSTTSCRIVTRLEPTNVRIVRFASTRAAKSRTLNYKLNNVIIYVLNIAVGTQSRHFRKRNFRVLSEFLWYFCHTRQTSIFHAKVHLHGKMIFRLPCKHIHTYTSIHCFMFSNQNVYFRHPLEIHAIYAIQIHKIRSYCTSAVSPSKNCVYLANKTKVNWWRKMSYEWNIYRVIVTYATSAFCHQK